MVMFMLLNFEDLNPTGLSFAVSSRVLCTPLGSPMHIPV